MVVVLPKSKFNGVIVKDLYLLRIGQCSCRWQRSKQAPPGEPRRLIWAEGMGWNDGQGGVKREGEKERMKEKKGKREDEPYSLMIAATWARNVATTWCPAGICRHDYGHRTSL